MGPVARPIAADVFQVGGAGLTDRDDAAVYLVQTSGGAAVIDSGTGRATDRLLMNIEAAGVLPDQVQWLLLTHCHYDHTGGAAELRTRFGWKVAMHALDAPFLEAGDSQVTAADWYGDRLTPCQVDRRIEDGEQIDLGGQNLSVVYIPGHSPGSVAYVFESRGRRVLFAQDVHGPIHPQLLSDHREYQQSLRKLLALEGDLLCEGHYGIFAGKEAVRGFIDRFLEH
jgi:glyoxylase-like metal-dependent hydrolase (beta-lactamase superfamily II)